MPAYVAPSPDERAAAAELIDSARDEALAQAMLAAEHARRVLAATEQAVELLRLAASTERVVRA